MYVYNIQKKNHLYKRIFLYRLKQNICIRIEVTYIHLNINKYCQSCNTYTHILTDKHFSTFCCKM